MDNQLQNFRTLFLAADRLHRVKTLTGVTVTLHNQPVRLTRTNFARLVRKLLNPYQSTLHLEEFHNNEKLIEQVADRTKQTTIFTILQNTALPEDQVMQNQVFVSQLVHSEALPEAEKEEVKEALLADAKEKTEDTPHENVHSRPGGGTHATPPTPSPQATTTTPPVLSEGSLAIKESVPIAQPETPPQTAVATL
jgi:hypothetical protein